MRARLLSCWAVTVLAAAFPLALPAEEPAASDPVVELGKSGDAVVLTRQRNLTPDDVSLLAARDPLPLFVLCAGGADCTPVSAILKNRQIQPGSASAERAVFQLSGVENGDILRVVHGETQMLATTIRFVEPADGPKVADDLSIAELLLNPCTKRPAEITPPVGYYRREDTIVVRVTPRGTVLSAPTEKMDENDLMVVHVLADPRLRGHLEVKRKSPIRTAGSFDVVGSGTPIQLPEGRAQAGLLDFPPCIDHPFVVQDFASGTGEVEIKVTEGPEQLTSSFDFIVHNLYHGMFSFGPLRSEVSQDAFSLAPRGDEQIIVFSENGGEDVFYSVLFTPFVWGQRDIEKPPLKFYHRVNPSFGVTLDDFSDNALAGISVDLGPFVFTGGVHFARVRKLSEKSGLSEGDPFAGEASEIPTTLHWDHGAFVGVSIDLRAASQLLQTLASPD